MRFPEAIGFIPIQLADKGRIPYEQTLSSIGIPHLRPSAGPTTSVSASILSLSETPFRAHAVMGFPHNLKATP